MANAASLLIDLVGRGQLRESATGRPLTDLSALAETLLDSDVAETTAALHALAAFIPDLVLAQRIRRHLDERRHPLPEGMSRIGELHASRAWVMLDPDGIGETWLLELAGAGVADVCATAYVDHRWAAAIKTAGLLDASVDQVIAQRAQFGGTAPGEAASSFDEVGLAEAGAKLRHGLAGYEEFRDEIRPGPNWPGQVPLFAHILRSLPEGGHGYPYAVRSPRRNQFTADADALDTEALGAAREFLTSRSGLYGPADAGVSSNAETFAVWAQEYLDPGSPSWTPDVIAWVMTWGLPVGQDPEPGGYRRALELFRDFVDHWHRAHDLGPAATFDAFAAVDRWENAYFAMRLDPMTVRRRRTVARLLGPEGLAG